MPRVQIAVESGGAKQDNSQYTVVSNMLIASIQQISKEAALTVIKDITSRCDLGSNLKCDGGNEKSILILWQCFHKYGKISWKRELGIYTQVCRRLIQQGYSVLWKEHPKTNKPFLRALLEIVPSIKPVFNDGDFEWPAEFLVANLGLSGCVSATSTSLFTLKILFDIPSYTFVENMLPYLNSGDLEVAHMVVKYVDSIKLLFEAIPFAD